MNPSSSQSVARTLKVACVGAGSITREFSLRHLHECPSVEVVAVVDLNLDVAQQLALDVQYRKAGAGILGSKYCETVDKDSVSIAVQDLPPVRAATTLADVLPLCDIVYVATPPASHAAVAIEALSAQKHVLLEKPLAVSLEDCAAITSAACDALQNHGLYLNVNIGMRHNAALHELKRLLYSPSFGDLQEATLRLLFRQWPRAWQNQPWVAERAQGGPMEEVGTHWLFGILELFGHDSYRGVDCRMLYPDGVEGRLCESHCEGHIMVSWKGTEKTIKFIIDCSSDEALALDKDVYELIVKGSHGHSYCLYDFTKLRTGKGEDIITTGTYGRKECIEELVRAVKGHGDEANLVTAAEAQNTQIIIDEMKRVVLC